MSAFANSAATQAAPPRPAPVPPVPAKPPSKRWLLWVVLIAAIAVGAWLKFRPQAQQQRSAAQAAVRTVKVAPGSFERRMRVAGTTAARNFANIVAPMMRGPDGGRALV